MDQTEIKEYVNSMTNKLGKDNLISQRLANSVVY